MVSSALTPGSETDVYKFSAQSGDYVSFEVSQLDRGANWRLLDPYGQTIFAQGMSHIDARLLRIAGDYTLVVSGNFGETTPNNYKFSVVTRAAPADPNFTGTALTLGAVTNGTFVTASERDDYVFTVAAQTRVAFDSLTYMGAFWRLEGRYGTEVDTRYLYSDFDYYNSGFAGQRPYIDLAPGTYRLSVNANGNTGAYAFRLYDLAASAVELVADQTVTAQRTPASESDVYKFSAAAGERIFIDQQQLDVGAVVRVIDPRGNQISYRGLGDISDLGILRMAGTYYVYVDGQNYDGGTANYKLTLRRPIDNEVPLAFDTTISGQITVPGQQNRYTFTVDDLARVMFDSLTGGGQITYRIFDSNGNQTVAQSLADNDSFYLQYGPGTYTLVIDGNERTTGAYSFRMVDLAKGAQINPNQLVSGTMTPGNALIAYQFDGQFGDHIQLDVLSGHAGGNWRPV